MKALEGKVAVVTGASRGISAAVTVCVNELAGPDAGYITGQTINVDAASSCFKGRRCTEAAGGGCAHVRGRCSPT